MKTILTAILSLALVSMLAGAGTLAYFSDTETSSGNTLTTGTMDLYMTDSGPIINAEWTLTDMLPGASWESGELNLWNTGNIEADQVQITFSTVCTDPGSDAGSNEESDPVIGAEGMDEYLQVTSMSYENTDTIDFVWIDITADPIFQWDDFYVTDSNGNDYIDLADLNGVTLDDLPAPPANGAENYEFRLEVRFHEDAPNDYQGDECELIITFTLNQDSSQ